MICYHENQFLEDYDAKASIYDKGFNFGYGVYEVILVHNGILVNIFKHIDRIYESAKFIDIIHLPDKSELMDYISRVVHLNRLRFGSIYIQITYGRAEYRNYNAITNQPSITITAQPEQPIGSNKITAMFYQDMRHGYRNIKSISLLPNVLLKKRAQKNGFDEIIMYDKHSNYVTECTSSNLFVVNHDQTVITPPDNGNIVPGITRNTVIDLFRQNNISVVEREITTQEVNDAIELFTTASITKISSIVKIGDIVKQSGSITDTACKLYGSFLENYDSQQA
ncbi:MAG: aminotransferase class IV family protein [Candidatus Xenolissoclinum pacificiensis L6]|uniref:Probable branched-chain-amino-acid aminotransferase n=1 Tax=Candidatus Xenolissoclinum pacificiensis L6 TaxID=1401685 RepID=W2UZR5_9RICK|nr:MAG: aminotransferase class IV family protein [Candidatus Xenolissoclinum pacificiensis L6]